MKPNAPPSSLPHHAIVNVHSYLSGNHECIEGALKNSRYLSGAEDMAVERQGELPMACTVNIPYNKKQLKDKGVAMIATRSKRIEARIRPDAFALVQRAAEMQGRSVSDFVVAAAEGAARKALEDAHTIRLSAEDQRRFVELLLDPPEPAPALRRAKEAHERLIGPL